MIPNKPNAAGRGFEFVRLGDVVLASDDYWDGVRKVWKRTQYPGGKLPGYELGWYRRKKQHDKPKRN